MKKTLFVILFTALVVYASLNVTCKLYGHQRFIFLNDKPYCQLVQQIDAGTKMTVNTKLSNLIFYPSRTNGWWLDLFKLKSKYG